MSLKIGIGDQVLGVGVQPRQVRVPGDQRAAPVDGEEQEGIPRLPREPADRRIAPPFGVLQHEHGDAFAGHPIV